MLCDTCKDKTCLKTNLKIKKPCKSAEEEMRKEGIYSRDYIRPKVSSNDRSESNWREIPMSNLNKEGKRAVEKKLGKGYWSE